MYLIMKIIQEGHRIFRPKHDWLGLGLCKEHKGFIVNHCIYIYSEPPWFWGLYSCICTTRVTHGQWDPACGQTPAPELGQRTVSVELPGGQAALPGSVDRWAEGFSFKSLLWYSAQPSLPSINPCWKSKAWRWTTSQLSENTQCPKWQNF